MEAVLPKIMNKVTKTFSKILEKYVRMNSFLELAILLKWFEIINFILKKLFLGIVQRFFKNFQRTCFTEHLLVYL